jgi:hypothetical protein
LCAISFYTMQAFRRHQSRHFRLNEELEDDENSVHCKERILESATTLSIPDPTSGFSCASPPVLSRSPRKLNRIPPSRFTTDDRVSASSHSSSSSGYSPLSEEKEGITGGRSSRRWQLSPLKSAGTRMVAASDVLQFTPELLHFETGLEAASKPAGGPSPRKSRNECEPSQQRDPSPGPAMKKVGMLFFTAASGINSILTSSPIKRKKTIGFPQTPVPASKLPAPLIFEWRRNKQNFNSSDTSPVHTEVMERKGEHGEAAEIAERSGTGSTEITSSEPTGIGVNDEPPSSHIVRRRSRSRSATRKQQQLSRRLSLSHHNSQHNPRSTNSIRNSMTSVSSNQILDATRRTSSFRAHVDASHPQFTESIPATANFNCRRRDDCIKQGSDIAAPSHPEESQNHHGLVHRSRSRPRARVSSIRSAMSCHDGDSAADFHEPEPSARGLQSGLVVVSASMKKIDATSNSERDAVDCQEHGFLDAAPEVNTNDCGKNNNIAVHIQDGSGNGGIARRTCHKERTTARRLPQHRNPESGSRTQAQRDFPNSASVREPKEPRPRASSSARPRESSLSRRNCERAKPLTSSPQMETKSSIHSSSSLPMTPLSSSRRLSRRGQLGESDHSSRSSNSVVRTRKGLPKVTSSQPKQSLVWPTSPVLTSSPRRRFQQQQHRGLTVGQYENDFTESLHSSPRRALRTKPELTHAGLPILPTKSPTKSLRLQQQRASKESREIGNLEWLLFPDPDPPLQPKPELTNAGPPILPTKPPSKSLRRQQQRSSKASRDIVEVFDT